MTDEKLALTKDYELVSPASTLNKLNKPIDSINPLGS
jgi:hypothetical protein